MQQWFFVMLRTRGDAPGCIYYPWQCEDHVRIEHPECVLANKYGTYMCQKAYGYCLVTEQEDAEAHSQRPFLKERLEK
ncbi:MAG: hypothetical protein JXB29_07580 [Sedimentisphaerales bacterium]|nr:hypothetical protein [Sedimentisphaerales bacterium]